MHTTAWEQHWEGYQNALKHGFRIELKVSASLVYPFYGIAYAVQKVISREMTS